MEINDENTDLPKNIENLEPRYFRTHQIVADISKNMNKIFASFALCHEHYYKSDNEEWVRGWFEITEEKLKYSAFAPLIYGAKGIIWFTYDTPCNPKNNNCLTDTLTGWVDKDAILDYKGNKTEKYEQVKNINAQLKAMGPVLIKLNWLETVHGSDINNFDINHTISVWLENNLPTVNDATPVLSDIGIINPSGAPFENEKNIAVGIFNESQGADYLLVFNKDLFGFRSIILEFEKVYNSYEFDYSSSTWVNQEVAITQLEIENIEPAGIKMIKLIEPELDPLCIDYGIYHGIIK